MYRDAALAAFRNKKEEDLAAFGLVLELFDHAVADRRTALEAGTPEQTRLRAR
jgi:hypothetical protein